MKHSPGFSQAHPLWPNRCTQVSAQSLHLWRHLWQCDYLETQCMLFLTPQYHRGVTTPDDFLWWALQGGAWKETAQGPELHLTGKPPRGHRSQGRGPVKPRFGPEATQAAGGGGRRSLHVLHPIGAGRPQRSPLPARCCAAPHVLAAPRPPRSAGPRLADRQPAPPIDGRLSPLSSNSSWGRDAVFPLPLSIGGKPLSDGKARGWSACWWAGCPSALSANRCSCSPCCSLSGNSTGRRRRRSPASRPIGAKVAPASPNAHREEAGGRCWPRAKLSCRPPSALPIAGPLKRCADGSWGPPPPRGPPAAQVPPPAVRGLPLPPPPPTAPPSGPRRSEPPAPQRCPSGRRTPALSPSSPFPAPSPRPAPPLLVAGPSLPFASGRWRAAPLRRRRPPLSPAPRDAALGLARASQPRCFVPAELRPQPGPALPMAARSDGGAVCAGPEYGGQQSCGATLLVSFLSF